LELFLNKYQWDFGFVFFKKKKKKKEKVQLVSNKTRNKKYCLFKRISLISSMIGFTLEIEDFIGESCIYNTQPYWCYIVKVRYSVYYPFPRVSFGEKKSFCFCQNGSPPFTVSRETIEDSGKERIRTEKVSVIICFRFLFFFFFSNLKEKNYKKKEPKTASFFKV